MADIGEIGFIAPSSGLIGHVQRSPGFFCPICFSALRERARQARCILAQDVPPALLQPFKMTDDLR
jgi:hypothetical protein